MALKRAPPRTPGGPKPRIMYIDLDLHFSDAVSQAFASSRVPQILVISHLYYHSKTLSIHHASPGFYPASPLSALPSPTSPTFSPYTLSLPLHPGASTSTYTRLLPLLTALKTTFSPTYIVLQCGVDALAGDPCAIANWSLEGLNDFVRSVLGWGLPTMILGGGGYNTPNAARAWASLTALALGEPLSLDAQIPDHPLFPLYGPSFTVSGFWMLVDVKA
ncbi:hypothetical protein C0995_001358 [Termitomyces sp. Mi166|nr:hypothetical protein C0995_001358 [Termitomyces sp. Mi166\